MDPTESSKVFVTGATGYIGGRLAPRLVERGYRVRCLARSAAKLRARPWAASHSAEVEIVEGDAADRDIAVTISSSQKCLGVPL